MICCVCASGKQQRGERALCGTKSHLSIEVSPDRVELNEPFEERGLCCDTSRCPLIKMVMGIHKTWSKQAAGTIDAVEGCVIGWNFTGTDADDAFSINGYPTAVDLSVL
ncbi:unannotated protein [freshwater metagenome]|uniref:Unannotated protein n=1 Tax=freshwater metagenome TaxID=449393 RepID=A0A6J7BMY3_9ZZZZ